MSPRHRRVTRAVALAAAGAVIACATVQAPPGGPEDHAPPKILRVTPDTGKLNVAPKEVVFRFDEVVNERPSGAAGALDQMVVVSPSDGAPRVSWHRDAITVRPRRNFRKNTAYTVTLLPGISDLRGNVLRTGASTFFSTGAEIPKTAVRGVVFDWVAAKPAVGALVQAFARGDTTFAWTAVTDSAGRFEIRAFPAGSYLLRGLVDANHNRELDSRELFDTVGIAIADSGRVELLAFVHDTIGPRIDKLAVEDSLTLRVDFDKPLDPARALTTANFALLRSDSTRIPIAALLTDSAFLSERRVRDSVATDSARAARPRGADSARVAPPGGAPPAAGSNIPLPTGRARPSARGRDTTGVAKPSRPAPRSTVMVRVGAPLPPVTAYRLRAIDVRGLVGNPRTSDRVFATPKPAGADSAKAPATRPDTSRARPPRP